MAESSQQMTGFPVEGSSSLTYELVRAAHARIRGVIHRTPVMTSVAIDQEVGARLFFKCENLQKAGAFKARGASNAVMLLSNEEAKHGVVTHSSGNHGAALARAGKLRGIPVTVVMPSNAPLAKRGAVTRYGGQVILCEPTLEARETAASRVLGRTGATLIHPHDDLRIMAGQGTAAIELLEDVPDLDLILCPVGGGGLLSGIAVAAKNIRPQIRVVGVEPAGASDAYQSLRAGRIVPSVKPKSIADGLLGSLGQRPFEAIRRYVDDIVLVSEETIVRGMRMIWEVMKLVVEPSGAVAFSAALDGGVSVREQRVGVILSGGNLDLTGFPWRT
jgi:threonine dehydratase